MSEGTRGAAADERIVDAVTCLGCGCTCDDITAVVRGGRIIEARRACPLGLRWFGDGQVSAALRARGGAASIDAVLDEAAAILAGARHPLVFLAPDVSCEAQRAAVAIADRLHAALDSITSTTAAPGILAAQRRGRPSATLGEIRNRGDVIIFWAVDPTVRYPRYSTRYAPEPAGLFVPDGRRSRTVVAVDIGEARGPADADVRVAIPAPDELTTIAALRARLGGRPGDHFPDAVGATAAQLATLLTGARYAVIVIDAERGRADEPAAPLARAEVLTRVAQLANGPTRCAISALRAGGNRNGADAVLTSQTGYPMAIEFGRGYPRYHPEDDAATLLARGLVDAALVIGDARAIELAARLHDAKIDAVAIGPWASESPLQAAVAIDTGIAGIHEGGTALRLDDVPLPLRPPLAGMAHLPEVAATLHALHARLGARGAGAAREASA